MAANRKQKKMSELTVQFRLMLSEKMRHDIRIEAAENDVSMAELVRRIIHKHQMSTNTKKRVVIKRKRVRE